MFNNIFRSSPVEPIFPKEKFDLLEIDMSDGQASAIINKAYDNYPNKRFVPWCAQIFITMRNYNCDNNLMKEEEKTLNDIEDRVNNFLKKKHQVHFIGRVTKDEHRDLFFYIDEPKFNSEELKIFFDSINKIREADFKLEKDKSWEIVADFLQ